MHRIVMVTRENTRGELAEEKQTWQICVRIQKMSHGGGSNTRPKDDLS